jgi:shikimate kinase
LEFEIKLFINLGSYKSYKIMKDKKIISLIGLMGVGKTTLGNKIAQKLQYYFIDLDQEIEDREHCSINEIFKKKGESFFRDIETKIINEIVDRDEEVVLSLGGGAYINQKSREILQKKSLVIWLHADLDEIVFRTSGKNNRPLLNKVDGMANKRKILQDLIEIREPFYKQCDLDFDTTNHNQEILVNKIIQQINELKNAK